MYTYNCSKVSKRVYTKILTVVISLSAIKGESFLFATLNNYCVMSEMHFLIF
jgi:hypothetical protein